MRRCMKRNRKFLMACSISAALTAFSVNSQSAGGAAGAGAGTGAGAAAGAGAGAGTTPGAAGGAGIGAGNQNQLPNADGSGLGGATGRSSLGGATGQPPLGGSSGIRVPRAGNRVPRGDLTNPGSAGAGTPGVAGGAGLGRIGGTTGTSINNRTGIGAGSGVQNQQQNVPQNVFPNFQGSGLGGATGRSSLGGATGQPPLGGSTGRSPVIGGPGSGTQTMPDGTPIINRPGVPNRIGAQALPRQGIPWALQGNQGENLQQPVPGQQSIPGQAVPRQNIPGTQQGNAIAPGIGVPPGSDAGLYWPSAQQAPRAAAAPRSQQTRQPFRNRALQDRAFTAADQVLLNRIRKKVLPVMGATPRSTSPVNFITRRGTVTLAGAVPSEDMRNRIVSAVKQMEGVRGVVDQMNVGPRNQNSVGGSLNTGEDLLPGHRRGTYNQRELQQRLQDRSSLRNPLQPASPEAQSQEADRLNGAGQSLPR